MKKCYVFLLMCWMGIQLSVAQDNSIDTKKYILCINAYTESSPWSYRLISAATEYVSGYPELFFYTEHMNMQLIENEIQLGQFKDYVFAKYRKPYMLLLLGNPAFVLRDEFREQWGDIPIVFCAEENYMGKREAYLSKRPVYEEERIPVSSLSEPYNLVLLHSDLYIQENVDLIAQMTPGMKHFVFIGDGRQINSANDYAVQRVLEEHYPTVKYEFLSARDISTEKLLDSLYHMDRENTGFLFASWIYKQTFAGNTSLVTSGYKLVETSPVPLFSLNLIEFTNEKEGFVGGYAYDQERYKKEMISRISQVLNGKEARLLPFYIPSDAVPVINYNIMLRKGLSPSLCPGDTHFLNKPPTFWEQHKQVLLASGVVLLVVLLFFFYRLHNLSLLRELQRKEIVAMNDYKMLIANMPVLYMQGELVNDSHGQATDIVFRKMNTRFENDFFQDVQVIGKKFSEVFPEATPEFLQFVQIVRKENRAVTFPWYFRRTDRSYDMVVSVSSQGGIVDVFCLDSTELHRLQQKLSNTNSKLAMALDVANIVPWKWDLRRHTILCDINKPIELSVHGEVVSEEQLAVPDTEYFSKIVKEDRERVREAYNNLLEGRSEKVKEEYRVVNVMQGIHRIEWVEAQAAVETRDREGRPLTLVGSSLVITPRKKMEMELMTAKDRAEESNRLKSAFLANMSHEIRTPLNAIVGFSGILASTEEEEAKQEYVSIIENNNALLLQLISDILDLSKIEAGTLDLYYSNVDLNQLMKDLENSCRLRLKSDQVKLEFRSPEKPEVVYSEKNRLSQLMINLITNAVKFTEKGCIRFGYERRGRELYFYVADTGCGIPKDKQDTIFGRFVKLNPFAQGTGLGLSICRTLVEAMDGRIGVESEEGQGSTFWFTLPYKKANVRETVKVEEIQPISVEKGKLIILVAEDNESNYKLFESILKYDYQLKHAWNGLEAVEMFREYNPQIVLMDINMPVMDGYEATREIRKYSAKVPIIAITAFAYASDEQRVMESGFDGYMPKPINAHVLKTQLADIMQKRIVLL